MAVAASGDSLTGSEGRGRDTRAVPEAWLQAVADPRLRPFVSAIQGCGDPSTFPDISVWGRLCSIYRTSRLAARN